MSFPSPIDDEYNPETVAWSSALGNFYDVDTGRVVSRLTGMEHLHAGRPFGRAGYVDDLGRAVPSVAKLVPAYMEFQFANQLRRATGTFADVYNERAPTGAYYLSFGIYNDDDGNLHFLIVPSKGGTAINIDDEQRRMARIIASELGIPEGAEGTKIIMEHVSQIFHFIVQ